LILLSRRLEVQRQNQLVIVSSIAFSFLSPFNLIRVVSFRFFFYLTGSPTFQPSKTPTVVPSCSPTITPTTQPTFAPTVAPTRPPTGSPTFQPTVTPTSTMPTFLPTQPPSGSPTIDPTGNCFLLKLIYSYACRFSFIYVFNRFSNFPTIENSKRRSNLWSHGSADDATNFCSISKSDITSNSPAVWKSNDRTNWYLFLGFLSNFVSVAHFSFINIFYFLFNRFSFFSTK
jgi:hypothetical protein